MSSVLYPKPAQTPQNHIALLEQRGMRFANKAAAAEFLNHISYYHLGLYWFDMRIKVNPQAGANNRRREEFRLGSAFEDVMHRYRFNKKLRNLVSSALETIELSLKTQWAQHFSLKYGPLFYSDIQYYNSTKLEGKTAADIIQLAENNFLHSKEDFISSYRRKLPKIRLPEAWIIAELLSFGEFVYFIRFLRPKYKRKFSALYAAHTQSDFLDEAGLITLLRQLRVIRNICAHNGRLWNRILPFPPAAPKNSPLLMQSLNSNKPQKIYNALCYIGYFLRKIDGGANWRAQVKVLMSSHADYSHAMGFRQNWQNTPLWA